MRGSILQNERYCSKEGELVHFGLPFIGKGGRRDLQVYYEKVKDGASDLDLADHDFGTFARTLKATDRIRLAVKPARRPQRREIILYVGAPRSGKSRRAYDTYPNIFTVPYSKNLWIDGYQREKEVLFEEFTGQYPLVGTLQLLDPWQTQKFEIKGGFQWFSPDVIVLTSNTHPREWYDYSKRPLQEEALRERFSKIIYYVTPTVIREYFTPQEIRHYWPIAAVDANQPNVRQVQPPVILNPVQEATRNGTLCHGCYVVPCACQPPEALNVFEISDDGI